MTGLYARAQVGVVLQKAVRCPCVARERLGGLEHVNGETRHMGCPRDSPYSLTASRAMDSLFDASGLVKIKRDTGNSVHWVQ